MNQGHPQQMEEELERQAETGHMEKDSYRYGTVPGDTIIKPSYLSWRRRRLNLVAIFICLFVPWLIFCFMFWLTSFKLFYRLPAVCYLIAFVVFGFIGMLGMKAFDAIKRSRAGDLNYEPTWCVFIFVTAFIAWSLGMYTGHYNFHFCMDAYYGIMNLGSYAGVNPATTHGQQLMDAGRVVFQPGTHLDLSKSMSFRNNELYCIAPIVNANASFGYAPESYDFWAVGVDCCCGDTVRSANFQCGEFDNSQAHSGLRLMKDEQRPFYRLAVQQAISTYGVRAKHPLFFHWVQDSVAAGESYRWEGQRQYLIGVYLHFAFQLCCVCLTAMIFARMEDK